MSNFQPTLQTNRIHFLDAWRGFSITGVLLAYIMWNLGNLPESKWNDTDRLIGRLTEILVDGKFYTTLSILFGFGFFLQFQKSRQNQRSIAPFALRRIVLLFVIGTLHALFLRRGDILMPYAICSLYLLFARNASNRMLIILMIFCFLFPVFYYQFLHFVGYKSPPWQQDSGSYLHYMGIAFVQLHNPVYFFVQALDYFLLFVFGFYAAKNNWLQKLAQQKKTLWILMFAGIASGIGLFFVMENSSSWVIKWFGPFAKRNFFEKLVGGYFGSLMYLLHRVFLAIGYFAGLYLVSLSRSKMGLFVSIGRMALSNYLMESLIMIPLCFIFGLFDHFTPTKALLWSLGLWVVHVVFSSLWLRKFQFGPFEWLLRSFTYWKWQPMKAGNGES